MSPNSRPRLSLPTSTLAAVVLMLAMPLAAQTASYTYIDQKAPYENPQYTMLTALNLPKIGTTFQVRVPASWYQKCGNSWFCGYDTWRYVLAFGVSNPNLPTPGLGGFLFTSADIVLPAPSIGLQPWGRSATMSFRIPNSPQLVGVRFYQQVLEVVSTGGFLGGTFRTLSRGGLGVIGK